MPLSWWAATAAMSIWGAGFADLELPRGSRGLPGLLTCVIVALVPPSSLLIARREGICLSVGCFVLNKASVKL